MPPQRFYSGRECWVFTATAPRHLCGWHGDLIARALGAECATFLLYAPRRDGDFDHFAIRNGSGSHGMALTPTRLLISCDRHDDTLPECHAIPIHRIHALHVGEALTLGWFVVDFFDGGERRRQTVCFSSSGIDLFRALVRQLRTTWGGVVVGKTMSDESLAGASSRLRSQVWPLLLSGERATVQADREADRPRTTYGSVCIGPASLTVTTAHHRLVATAQRPRRRGDLVFGVDVVLSLR
jgi:hypothetical protein